MKNRSKATHTYWIERWGPPYFSINDQGNVSLNGEYCTGDLYQLVQTLIQRGIEAPILIRFTDILKDRIHQLQQAFESAIKEFQYKNHYQIAFPIKVNPQRDVVEFIEQTGRPKKLSLEVGSKPELLAVMTLDSGSESLLLCNGYKDVEYIELALAAKKLGKRSVIIIEQPYELQLVLEAAERLGQEAEIGFRMKLSQKGSGHWESSSGEFAKFGLTIYEIMDSLTILEKQKKKDWLKLLHFHIGSQIPSIHAIKKALSETTQMFVELAKICPSLCFFDAGGGLAVDYDGTNSSNHSSMNYSIEEYARDIVFALGEACSKASIPHPTILSESGRALVAHHAVLITEVIDVTSTLEVVPQLEQPITSHRYLINFYELYQNLIPSNCHETLHDALQLRELSLDAFIQGLMSLPERAYAEKAYRHLMSKIGLAANSLQHIPEEIERLCQAQKDTYFCNFSVFQSLPDSWAIQQLFPLMPIHRLKEAPTRRSILADMTCDSDGKIDHFIGRGQAENTIFLHPFNGVPYYLGIFLVGAYQEILGDFHNLFGDTNTVHAELDSKGQWKITQVVEGDSIEEVLAYAQYHPQALLQQLRNLMELNLRKGVLTNEESAKLQKKFKKSLESYTYLTI